MSAINDPSRWGKGYGASFANRFRVDVTGDKELMAALKDMGRVGIDAAKEIFGRKADQIVAQAKPLTPYEPEFGTALRDSVRHTKVVGSVTRGKVTVTIVAGGEPLESVLRASGHTMNAYAYIQHEDTTLKHPGGGGPKYIERPVLAIAPSIPSELQAAVVRLANAS